MKAVNGMEEKKLNLNKVNLVMTAGLPSQLPGILRSDLPQIAMCGRSNVGKSSLINKLLGRKSLARVSAEPGKTITVNCYDIDSALYLVDLPGYGYAKRSFSERDKWKKLIDRYFSLEAPRLYLQLVDLKVGLTADDPAIPSDAEILPFSAKTGAGADDIWRIIKEFSAAVTGTQFTL